MSTIYETLDFGYDPSVPEPQRKGLLPPSTVTPPSSSIIPSTYLPTVGKQTIPNCFVWSTTYGLASYWAAVSTQTPPSAPYLEPSPDYTYIRVQMKTGVSSGNCYGGQLADVFQYLIDEGGTAALAIAPNNDECSTNWSEYGGAPLGADPRFSIPDYASFGIKDAYGLSTMRSLISAGVPLAYGTHLYENFSIYDGTPAPYVGKRPLAMNKRTKKPTGHCMMIIGYDDAFPSVDGPVGAVYIQNSFGSSWGANGYVWMAYTTFQKLAEGSAFYIPDPSWAA
jgi:Papain family cysteine protease